MSSVEDSAPWALLRQDLRDDRNEDSVEKAVVRGNDLRRDTASDASERRPLEGCDAASRDNSAVAERM